MIAVAADLLYDVSPGVFRAFAIKFVDRHQIGEIEHIDLLKLCGCPELRCHNIKGEVTDRHHRSISLSDARGLDNNQVEPGSPNDIQRILDGEGELGARFAGGQRTHVNPFSGN